MEYLYASHPSIIRDLPTLSISLGPYNSYYAWDRTSASWSNLPASLEKGILARLESQDAWKTLWKAGGAEAPCFVSLGADGAYFMRTMCGGGCWDLKSGKNGDGKVGVDGLRGTNEFLEGCRDFCGIAVSLNLDLALMSQCFHSVLIRCITGATSIPIAARCLYPDPYVEQGILKPPRVYLVRLQQDGSCPSDIHPIPATHTSDPSEPASTDPKSLSRADSAATSDNGTSTATATTQSSSANMLPARLTTYMLHASASTTETIRYAICICSGTHHGATHRVCCAWSIWRANLPIVRRQTVRSGYT